MIGYCTVYDTLVIKLTIIPKLRMLYKVKIATIKNKLLKK